MAYRVQVVGAANFVWTVVLDYITHESAAPHDASAPQSTKRMTVSSRHDRRHWGSGITLDGG